MPYPPPPVNPQRLSPAESRERTLHFFHGLGVDVPLPASAERADAYVALVRAIVSSATVSSSRVSCTLTISPGVAVSALLLSLSLPSPDYLRPGGPARWVQNQYNTLDGGAVAAMAETVGLACARAAAGDKEMFLGELSTAYLAAARVNVSSSLCLF